MVDGIYYNLNKTEKTASVTYEGSTAPTSYVTTYKGEVTIPETFTYNGIEYTVTEIGENAFLECNRLTRLILPGSIRTIGSCAFEDTYNLKELELPEGVTDIANEAFRFSRMEKLVLPSTLRSIGDNAFIGNNYLKELNIPAATTEIPFGYIAGDYCNPFGLNDALLAINVDADNPNFSSKDGVLYNKDQTTVCAFPGGITERIFMPSTVTKIVCHAFWGRSKATVFFTDGLKEIEILAFSGSKGTFYFGNLPEYNKYVWSGMSDATVYVPADEVASVKSMCEGKVYPLLVDFPYMLQTTSFIKGLSLTLEKNPYYNGEADAISKSEMIKYPDSLIAQYDPTTQTFKYVGLQPNTTYGIRLTTQTGNTLECTATTKSANVQAPTITPYMAALQIGTTNADTDETATIKEIGFKLWGRGYYDKPHFYSDKDTLFCGLEANYPYYVTPFVVYEGDDTKVYGSEIEKKTNAISMHEFKVTSTQRTLTFKRSSMYKVDTTVKVEEAGIVVNGYQYVPFDENGYATLTGLSYNTKYNVQPYIKYNGGKRQVGEYSAFYTQNVIPQINVIHTATSLSITPDTCGVGDAGLLGWNLYCDGKDLGQDSLYLKGLSPQQSVKIRLRFELQHAIESADFTPTTLPLEFNLLTPKCVSATSAIVAAETNVDPNETNVGFQWKKFDAPESLEPKEAYTILEEGKIEGIIKNLQTSSYYNVRAFYQADDGTRHYGQWLTFDPSDYSYFEPTVRTYPDIEVSDNSAIVKGYALEGSDEIIKQGFQYWSLDKSTKSTAARSPETNEVHTVEAPGQVMTAVLPDLLPATTYCYRAFVTTQAGTLYGSEFSFVTQHGETGIQQTDRQDAIPQITGYYTLDGRMTTVPGKGFYIIRYSDGSARKVYLR